jgi:chloramphenicol 3-O-phosphotransferase
METVTHSQVALAKEALSHCQDLLEPFAVLMIAAVLSVNYQTAREVLSAINSA